MLITPNHFRISLDEMHPSCLCSEDTHMHIGMRVVKIYGILLWHTICCIKKAILIKMKTAIHVNFFVKWHMLD